MSPFDVERFLDFPVVGAGPDRVGCGQGRGLAILIEDGQERRRRPVLIVQRRSGGRQAELGVERIEGLVDARVVVGIDDGDGLAGAVEREALVPLDAVGGPDLGRRVGDRSGGRSQGQALATALPLIVSVSTTIEIGFVVLPTWALPLSTSWAAGA